MLEKKRDKIYLDLLKEESGYHAEKLAFLDRGIQNSPYRSSIEEYPKHLTQKPTLAIAGDRSFPTVGKLPEIDEGGLDFLHPDIQDACVCIGGADGDLFKARWLGRNALNKVQYWSSTKIVAILNLLCCVRDPMSDCTIGYGDLDFPVFDLVDDVVTYDETIATSNSISAMFKCFQTYANLEIWLKKITGNLDLNFQGLYGEEPFIASPILRKGDGQVIFKAAGEQKNRTTQPGENLLSAYVLTRLMAMVGWHHHLSDSARLPGLMWENLQPFIRCSGKDLARFTDVAIEQLGLHQAITSPVILSKMGFGYSQSRQRTEIAYTCFTQFSQGGRIQSVAMTLRGAKVLGDLDREAIELDARMATEVSEILRRLVTGELLQ